MSSASRGGRHLVVPWAPPCTLVDLQDDLLDVLDERKLLQLPEEVSHLGRRGPDE